MTTTLIAKRTRVGGRIETHGDVVVEGRVEGSIVAAGTVTIGVSGVAVSDIHAGRAVILGIVIGDIEASERIDVAASARIVGDVRSPSNVVALPSSVEGRVEETPAGTPLRATPSGSLPAVSAGGGVQAARPTLRIRGAGLVRPARPAPEPAAVARSLRDTADMSQRHPQRARDAGTSPPPPPRPPSRTRMVPRAVRSTPPRDGGGNRGDE